MTRGRPWLATAVAALAATAAAHADPWRPLGPWRVAESRIAPWAPSDTRPSTSLRGAQIRFEADRVVAPEPLGCDGARYEWRVLDADGLFEGNLARPADTTARALGFASSRVPTLRVTCRNAAFDFHRDAMGALRLALDATIWTLHAASTPTEPASVVESLLVRHFADEMAFTRGSVERKRTFLSAGLLAAARASLARPAPADEPPVVDGDPFTDTQEYPDRFAIAGSDTDGARATVHVEFADDHVRRRIAYRLVREDARWVVDDLAYEHGTTLRVLLASDDPAPDFDAFLADFRRALDTGRAAEVAALVRVPFLYEGRGLDVAGVTAIVPELFTPAVRTCLRTTRPTVE